MADNAVNDAHKVIAAFGGIRPMAKKLGVAVTTVQGWKERGAIPLARLNEIRAAAEREDIDLSEEALARFEGAPEDAGEAAAEKPKKAKRVRAEKVEEPVRSGVEAAGKEDAARIIEGGPARGAKPWVRPLLLGAGFGLACAAGIAGTWLAGLYWDRGPGPVDAALQKRLAAAESRLAGLSRRIADSARLEAAVGNLRKQVAALDRRLASLPAKARDAGALAAALKDLSDKVAALTGLADKVAALESRLDKAVPGDPRATRANAEAIKALRERNTALRAALAKTATESAAQRDALTKKIAALQARLKDVAPESTVGIAANAESIAKLKAANDALRAALDKAAARIALLEKEGRTAASVRMRTGALIVAVGHLREAAARGESYADALAPLRTVAARHPPMKQAMATLERFAATGVPTATRLRDRFGKLATAIVRAGRLPEKGNWIDRAWARARSVVIIRRTGADRTGDTPEAIVARAEAAVNAGDLKGAVKTLAALKGPAAKAAQAWLGDARNRLAVDDALRALNSHAVDLALRKAKDDG